jgi:hypothetical protein
MAQQEGIRLSTARPCTWPEQSVAEQKAHGATLHGTSSGFGCEAWGQAAASCVEPYWSTHTAAREETPPPQAALQLLHGPTFDRQKYTVESVCAAGRVPQLNACAAVEEKWTAFCREMRCSCFAALTCTASWRRAESATSWQDLSQQPGNRLAGAWRHP